MIRAFRNAGIQHVFHDVRSKLAVKTCPPELWRVAQRRLDQLNQAEAFDDLRAPPGNRLELEAGDRASQHRIRIN
jgi:proteic killer suppression protein